VLEHEAAFRAMLDGLRDIPIVGDVRGAGYFQAIELVSDGATKGRFPAPEREALLRGFIGPELYRRGLICRVDDRGDPVIQLAPPLIAGPDEFAEIESILRPVLSAAAERVASC
jgi:adenosylmethionine-8-amino-7-oxononanoate aminotransferase